MFKALSIYGYKTTESDAKWAMLSAIVYDDSTFHMIFVKITLNSLP